MESNLDILKRAAQSATETERRSALAALADFPLKDTIDVLVECLGDADRGVSEAASLILIKQGDQAAILKITPLLASDNITARNLAIEILKKIGKKSPETIIHLLKEPDADVRIFALNILEETGTPAVFQPVLLALNDANMNVASLAAEVLGKIGDPRAVESLITCLGRETWMRCAAIESLGCIGGNAALDALLMISPDDKSTVLFTLINALGKIKSARALPLLERLVVLKRSPISELALQTISDIIEYLGATGKMKPDDLIITLTEETLISFLDNRIETISSALKLLIQYGSEDSVQKLLKTLFLELHMDELPKILAAALKLRPALDVRLLVRLLDSPDLPEQSKRALVEVLGDYSEKNASGASDALAALLAHLKYGSDALKPVVLMNLARFDFPERKSIILEKMEAPDENMRAACVRALINLDEHTMFDGLLQFFEDPTISVRRTAVETMANRLNKQGARRLVQLLNRASPPAIECILQAIQNHLTDELTLKLFEMLDASPPELYAPLIAAISSQPSINEQQANMIREAVERGLASKNAAFRLPAIKTLKKYREPAFSRALMKILSNDSEEERIRYEAALALQCSSTDDIIPEMTELLQSVPPLVQTGVMDALGGLRVRSALPLLEQLAGSEHMIVRVAAKNAIAEIRGGESC